LYINDKNWIKRPTNEQTSIFNQDSNMFNINNQNVIFTRADKGNITVAIDRISYISKVEELLNDDNTYTVVKRNPIRSIENKLNNVLKNGYKTDISLNSNSSNYALVTPFYQKRMDYQRYIRITLLLE